MPKLQVMSIEEILKVFPIDMEDVNCDIGNTVALLDYFDEKSANIIKNGLVDNGIEVLNYDTNPSFVIKDLNVYKIFMTLNHNI